MPQHGKHLRGTRFPHCLENPLRETGFTTLPQAQLLGFSAGGAAEKDGEADLFRKK